MIIDKISNMKKYIPLVQNLELVSKLLDNGEIYNASLGKHETSNPDVFYKIMEYDLELTENNCEIHNQWIDVIIIQEGLEKMAMPVNMPYTEVSPVDATDMGWMKASDYRTYWLGDPENFILLFPGELHAPALIADKKRKIRKIVIKIRNK